MKLIGLIGGTTWQSTKEYYRILNELVSEHLGGRHSARILLSSIDYEEIYPEGHLRDWGAVAKIILREAKRLENAGAEVLLIGANTLHQVFEDVQENVKIPIIHIADEVAKAIQAERLQKALLLGTRFTMGLPFYRDRLAQSEIESIIPSEEDRNLVDRVIYDELVHGKIREESKERYLKIIAKASQEGAQGVILGCTEIPLLIHQKDLALPLFDSTQIHAEAAFSFAMKEN